jgi:hypothetical protein
MPALIALCPTKYIYTVEAGKYGERIPVVFANSAGFFLFRSSLDGNWNEGKDFMTT